MPRVSNPLLAVTNRAGIMIGDESLASLNIDIKSNFDEPDTVGSNGKRKSAYEESSAIQSGFEHEASGVRTWSVYH